MSENALVIVALRTNQHDIKRRLDLILAAADPYGPRDTNPSVYVKDVDDLVAADLDALKRFFEPSGIQGLNVGSTDR